MLWLLRDKAALLSKAHQAPPSGWVFPLFQAAGSKCSHSDWLQLGVASLLLGSPVYLPVSDGETCFSPDFIWTSLLAAFKGLKTSNLQVDVYLKDNGLGAQMPSASSCPAAPRMSI